MDTSATALKAQFDLHTRLFNNALSGIDDTDANARRSEHVNHMKWIAGHLLNTRLGSLSKMAGLQPDDSYAGQFGRGVAVDNSASYPPIAQIADKWKDTATAISDGLSNIPEEVLSSKSPAQAPIADDSIRGLLAFLISHEAYHIGQLGLLRKMAGKEATSYN
jgi:uncharacterized damage-inducible protein DinB